MTDEGRVHPVLPVMRWIQTATWIMVGLRRCTPRTTGTALLSATALLVAIDATAKPSHASLPVKAQQGADETPDKLLGGG